MFVICDSSNVVQDIASIEANLARGKTYPGYKQYEVANDLDIKISDTYDGVKVTQNTAVRNARIVKGLEYKIVELGTKIDKADSLGYTTVKDEMQAKYDALIAQRTGIIG